jgi:hypothetical protein
LHLHGWLRHPHGQQHQRVHARHGLLQLGIAYLALGRRLLSISGSLQRKLTPEIVHPQSDEGTKRLVGFGFRFAGFSIFSNSVFILYTYITSLSFKISESFWKTGIIFVFIENLGKPANRNYGKLETGNL